MPEAVTTYESRGHLRTHIFLAAQFNTPSGNCAARIRNMSRTGALVEASILPEAGTPVRLVRGSLEAAGETVWRSGSRCGVAFSSLVSVEAWLPDLNGRQARVDALVGGIRNDNSFPELLEAAAALSAEPDQAFKVLADLARSLGHRLASDAVMVARFSSELQGFDILAQALEALGSQQPGSRRRLDDTVSACGELLNRLNAGSEDLCETHGPERLRSGASDGFR